MYNIGMGKELTEFGKFFKKVRKIRKQNLEEASKILKVSISYISAVEHGNRPIPSGWKEKIISFYNLDHDEIEELDFAINNTPRDIKIPFSDIERCLTNFVINQTSEGTERDKAMQKLNDVLDSLKKTSTIK